MEREKLNQMRSLIEIGYSYIDRCEITKACDTFLKIKEMSRENLDEFADEYFTSAEKLLRLYSEKKEPEKVQELIQEMEESLTKIFDPKYVVSVLYHQGMNDYFRKNHDSAMGHFTRAFAFLKEREKTSIHKKAQLLLGLSSVLYDQGKYIEMQGCLGEVLELIGKRRDTKSRDLLISVYIALGHVRRERGEYEGALQQYWEAHKLLKRRNNWYLHYFVMFGIACTYIAMEDYTRASVFLDIIWRSIEKLELNMLKSLVMKKKKLLEDKNVLETAASYIIEDEDNERRNGIDRRVVLLDILYLLTETPDKVINKEEMVRRVWREEYNPLSHDSRIYTNIRRLRKLIEPDSENPQFILCEKEGYKFNSNVTMSIH